MRKSIFTFNVHDIVEIAMLCALAIVLDTFVKIPFAPTGGSINLAVLPLVFIALRHGWFKAFIAGGVVFGGITCLIDGYGIATYPLEYLVAFGSIGIVGLFGRFINNNFKTKGGVALSYITLIEYMIIWAIIRFFAASIDSVLIYGYSWSASFAYNAGYVFLSAIVVTILACILLPGMVRLNRVKTFQTAYLKEGLASNKEEAQEETKEQVQEETKEAPIVETKETEEEVVLKVKKQ